MVLTHLVDYKEKKKLTKWLPSKVYNGVQLIHFYYVPGIYIFLIIIPFFLQATQFLGRPKNCKP